MRERVLYTLPHFLYLPPPLTFFSWIRYIVNVSKYFRNKQKRRYFYEYIRKNRNS